MTNDGQRDVGVAEGEAGQVALLKSARDAVHGEARIDIVRSQPDLEALDEVLSLLVIDPLVGLRRAWRRRLGRG